MRGLSGSMRSGGGGRCARPQEADFLILSMRLCMTDKKARLKKWAFGFRNARLHECKRALERAKRRECARVKRAVESEIERVFLSLFACVNSPA